MDELDLLVRWFEERCDGLWEHIHRINIESLDNPGWSVEIDLGDTPLENCKFEPVVREESETDWISCRLKQRRFQGAGGPATLREILRIFLSWAQSEPEE